MNRKLHPPPLPPPLITDEKSPDELLISFFDNKSSGNGYFAAIIFLRRCRSANTDRRSLNLVARRGGGQCPFCSGFPVVKTSKFTEFQKFAKLEREKFGAREILSGQSMCSWHNKTGRLETRQRSLTLDRRDG